MPRISEYHWVSITMKRLWCPRQNHSVIMKMSQNNEPLRSYYKKPNIHTHISTMILSLMKCVPSFYTISFHWMYLTLACPAHCSAYYSVCNEWLNDTKSNNVLHCCIVHNKLFDKTRNFDHVCSIFMIILNILPVSLKLLSTCCYGATAPVRNPLMFSVTLKPPFCLYSVEA